CPFRGDTSLPRGQWAERGLLPDRKIPRRIAYPLATGTDKDLDLSKALDFVRQTALRGRRRPPGIPGPASGPEPSTRPASPCPAPRSARRRTVVRIASRVIQPAVREDGARRGG